MSTTTDRITWGDVRDYADDVGLLCKTYNPGDGQTRYRFFVRADCPPGQSYFGPRDGLFTTLGPARAMIFLAGYAKGKSAK